MMTTSNCIREEADGVKVWIHEVSRVFHDRLNCEEDREWFYNLIIDISGRKLNKKLQKSDITNVLFGDILTIY